MNEMNQTNRTLSHSTNIMNFMFYSEGSFSLDLKTDGFNIITAKNE